MKASSFKQYKGDASLALKSKPEPQHDERVTWLLAHMSEKDRQRVLAKAKKIVSKV